jgi:DNA topoisomerase-1
MPGIRRIRCGRGFRYIDPGGHTVRDADVLARIHSLAIPPAYRDVWICTSPHGHLQATGRDARGRKQYRYHPHWRSARDAHKFERLAAFCRALPRLRRAVRADLALRGLPQAKVLAAVVWTLSVTLLRIGNGRYRRDNGSFGLTTLRGRHVRFFPGGLRLRFVGKGGTLLEADIDDPRLARLVRTLHQLPGQALFQYRDTRGQLLPVDSGQVNTYLHEHMGADFTAKDFRTWGATRAAIDALSAIPPPHNPTPATTQRIERQVVAGVAALLGNTPAVCRKSYIDPCVFAGWRDGSLHAAMRGARGARQRERASRQFLEHAHSTYAFPAR